MVALSGYDVIGEGRWAKSTAESAGCFAKLWNTCLCTVYCIFVCMVTTVSLSVHWHPLCQSKRVVSAERGAKLRGCWINACLPGYQCWTRTIARPLSRCLHCAATAKVFDLSEPQWDMLYIIVRQNKWHALFQAVLRLFWQALFVLFINRIICCPVHPRCFHRLTHSIWTIEQYHTSYRYICWTQCMGLLHFLIRESTWQKVGNVISLIRFILFSTLFSGS